MILWIISIVIGCYILYLATGVIEGVLDSGKRPMEQMELCYKHGIFRKKHVLNFMGVTVCPRCYEEAWKDVEKKA